MTSTRTISSSVKPPSRMGTGVGCDRVRPRMVAQAPISCFIVVGLRAKAAGVYAACQESSKNCNSFAKLPGAEAGSSGRQGAGARRPRRQMTRPFSHGQAIRAGPDSGMIFKRACAAHRSAPPDAGKPTHRGLHMHRLATSRRSAGHRRDLQFDGGLAHRDRRSRARSASKAGGAGSRSIARRPGRCGCWSAMAQSRRG